MRNTLHLSEISAKDIRDGIHLSGTVILHCQAVLRTLPHGGEVREARGLGVREPGSSKKLNQRRPSKPKNKGKCGGGENVRGLRTLLEGVVDPFRRMSECE